MIPLLIKNFIPICNRKALCCSQDILKLSKLVVGCLSSPQAPELDGSSLTRSDLAIVSAAPREKKSAYLLRRGCLPSCDDSRSSYQKKQTSNNKNFKRLREATFSQPLRSLSPSVFFCGFMSEIKKRCWMWTAEQWKGVFGQFLPDSRFQIPNCSPAGRCPVSLLLFPKESESKRSDLSWTQERAYAFLIWKLCYGL